MPVPTNIRPWQATDSVAALTALTALLHTADTPLGAAGMNFSAVAQTEPQPADGRLRDGLVVQADETWATCQAPPAWRTAEAIGADRRGASAQPPNPA